MGWMTSGRGMSSRSSAIGPIGLLIRAGGNEDLPPLVLGCIGVHHSNLRADGYQRESSYGGNRWKVPGKYRDHL